MILALDGFALDGSPCAVLTSRASATSIILSRLGPERLIVYRHGSAIPHELTTNKETGLLCGTLDGELHELRALRAMGAHSLHGILVLAVPPDVRLQIVGRKTVLGPELTPLTVELDPRGVSPEVKLLTMRFLVALQPQDDDRATVTAIYYVSPATALDPSTFEHQARLFVAHLCTAGHACLVMDPCL
ncbi:hypothetical protein GMRT_21137 [Giardia muris]|uniref:Uncharacterized protein n=1 Tax=Giardia muris TaxID=5742 RepID=A0A4Z1SX53_GIAMU|nr:hypothetical protein GMRT_21137 [Giardia muris]|eukprot:TNJ30314.1 hypothetical protein GMRT_21137 [Giardia muris]